MARFRDVSGVKPKKKPSAETKLKQRTKRSGKKNKDCTSVSRPKTAEECSANWKVLSQVLCKEKQTKPNRVERIAGKSSNTSAKKSFPEKPDIWFDDIAEEEILLAEGVSTGGQPGLSQTEDKLIKHNAFGGLTKAVGMDCEMVGTGYNGSQSVLARVSIVNQYGKCIYDKHVKARDVVTDYRTWVSGVRPSDLTGAEEFGVVQREVARILKGRILVGHALHNDLKVLFLNHPKKLIRDTAEYKPFRAFNGGRTPALRVLSSKVLGVEVQKGEHSSVQDAQAAVKLYMLHKKQWEKELKLSKNVKK